ncbi:hypothetical protein GCM10022403_035380 [Streptomyces coacervatus]|uniref:Zinc ribbon domain-containing protein n=1 Tax=Streptomyces coacervatus TaxID=647381 RepID=A0ABP7HLA8_9ACTN|nr:hypothetical protein [Streptomyces coacervatus]MDF2271030.1 hypothetical protein [Streptomyces coacervatus]
MDYCSSCRRHLNGALVCPGCGAYAPDIAPVTAHGRTTAAPAAMASWPEPAAASAGISAGIPDADAYDDFDGLGGLDDFQAAEGGAERPATASVSASVSASQGPGRAARRRQRARWKKNQRKAVVATAVALVGGGLTVASMDRGSGHGNQASAATDLSSMGSGEKSVDTSADLPSTAPGTGKHRKPRADEASTGGSAQRSTTATAPHTDSAKTQQYTAPKPSSTSATAVQQATGAVEDTTSTATDTVSKTTQPSSSTSTSGTSTSSGSGSGSGSSSTSSGSSSNTSGSGSSDTSQSGSGTASTSPSGLCVLNLLCVS